VRGVDEELRLWLAPGDTAAMKKAPHRDRPFLMEVTLLRDQVPAWDEYPFNLPVVRNGIERVAYTDTEHYATTKSFLNDHRTMLRRLLGEDAV